jgi:hypothetical protein
MTDAQKAKAISFMPDKLAGNVKVNVWMEIASLRVSESFFGTSYPLALSYMASHIGILEMRGNGVGGPITSRSEGSISESYAAPSIPNQDLSSTSYGVAYVSLMRSFKTGFGISGGI